MKPPLTFYFITLFPEVISVWLRTSILGRAEEAGLFTFRTLQLRDFAADKHRTVDDAAYGGGGGMVLKIEPLVAAVESVFSELGRENCRVIYFSPVGKRMDQQIIDTFAQLEKVRTYVLICGHYEGVDQRFVEGWVDVELSLGDFVLTGGEIPALAFADALIRQQEGALGCKTARDTESFHLKHEAGLLLEYPHYTRPAEFRGRKVPEVLLSGDHDRIAHWRRNEAMKRTQSRRPELLLTKRGEGT